MRCPVDETELVMSDRQGIEIDYCPKCRGVWLDRGEIDKIIERSTAQGPAPSYQPQPQSHSQRDDRQRYDDDDDHYRHESHGHYDQRKKHKESWFGELFD